MFPPIKRNSFTQANTSSTFRQTPTSTTRAHSKGATKTHHRSSSTQFINKKPQRTNSDDSGAFNSIPYSCLRRILSYTINSYEEILQLQRVCKRFWAILYTDPETYTYICPFMNGCSASEIRDYLTSQALDRMASRYDNFMKKTDQLFLYGATKMNLPDKLLDSLKLTSSVIVNSRVFRPSLLIRKANFATHLYFKISLDEVECNMYANPTSQFSSSSQLDIKLNISSSQLGLVLPFQRIYPIDRVIHDCIRQKTFNYFLDCGLLITFFEGDSHALYLVYEVSAVQVIAQLRSRVKMSTLMDDRMRLRERTSKAKLMIRSQETLKKCEGEQDRNISPTHSIAEDVTFMQQQIIKQGQQVPNKAIPLIGRPPKTKVRTPVPKLVSNRYSSLQQYLQDQQDFEFIVNIHNGIKGQNLFMYIDTKALPKIVNDKLCFQYMISEAVDTSTQFFLDNRSGMRELVPDLYLGDIVVKDRDRFILLFSGFVQASQIVYQSLKEYNIPDIIGFDEVTWKRLQVRLDHNSEFTLIYALRTKKQSRAYLLQLNLSLQSIDA